MSPATAKRPSRGIIGVALTMIAILERNIHDGALQTGCGTGLQGIADRLDAIGRTLSVAGRTGAGTKITGTVPATAAAER